MAIQTQQEFFDNKSIDITQKLSVRSYLCIGSLEPLSRDIDEAIRTIIKLRQELDGKGPNKNVTF